MKQINLFKILLLVAFMAVTGIVNAQVHPLAFGSYTLGTISTSGNWYADYVGLRLEVVTPLSDAGNKAYKSSNSGTGATGDWGGFVSTPLVDLPIEMPQAGDSLCTVGTVDHTITTDMTGKIGFVYRGSSFFGDKADDCQNAGAVACIIVNNIPGGPVGMASGGAGGSVTIPIFMISQADGNIIDSLYNAGVVAHITITQWGQMLNNDLGFVPGGAAMWHNYAIPSNQLGASGNPVPYNMLDGAFIANYGIHPATNIKVLSQMSFTPTGGIATVQHSDSVTWEGPFYDDTLSAHNLSDSIMAMFSHTEYPLSASGTGLFSLNYTISSDSVDQYPADNTLTVNTYITDSVYSKGTYDFVNSQPSRSTYEQFGGGNEFMWGPMYYVANGGTTLSSVQYSLAINSGTSGYPYLAGANNVYLFQWVDGAVGSAPDSVIEDGELQLVGTGNYTFNGTTDTNEVLLTCRNVLDSIGNQPALAANTWYYVCIDVPATTAIPMFLGCDGVVNPYPRVYGRFHADNNLFDYSSIEVGGTLDTLAAYTNQENPPLPGGETGLVNSVDSFVFSNMAGLIPAVAMIANNNPTTAVKQVAKPLANVNLYPNPAKDQMNVSVSFDKNEPTVSYEIIDGLARFVSKETHNNVQSETYTINTSKLAAGSYYLIINAEGKVMSKKFVVIK